MAKIKITQTRSAIRCTKNQKAVIAALGLRRLNQTVEQEDNAAIQGMVRKVRHLVQVENA